MKNTVNIDKSRKITGQSWKLIVNIQFFYSQERLTWNIDIALAYTSAAIILSVLYSHTSYCDPNLSHEVSKWVTLKRVMYCYQSNLRFSLPCFWRHCQCPKKLHKSINKNTTVGEFLSHPQNILTKQIC